MLDGSSTASDGMEVDGAESVCALVFDGGELDSANGETGAEEFVVKPDDVGSGDGGEVDCGSSESESDSSMAMIEVGGTGSDGDIDNIEEGDGGVGGGGGDGGGVGGGIEGAWTPAYSYSM